MTAHQPEQALGKYQVVRELGRGGFATVYLAQDTVLRRSVALKILHPALLADPNFVQRFEQEAHATAQLDHPHIATIFDLGLLDGRLYIAMRLLAGGTLADRVKQRGPLPFAEAARVIEQVADALDHAHAAGFIHRDVKPTNILFDARGAAVLSDFGMVKAVESSVIARTSMGNVIGTPAYIAPEIWEGKEAGPAADTYALGCVLFEMLTGELLFKGGTPPAVMMAHFQPHQYPAAWPDATPPQVEELLEQALSRDIAIRFAGAGAFVAALRGLDQRPADALAEPYWSLEAALTAQDWRRALRLAREIITANPAYRDVQALAQRASEGQAQADHASLVARWRDATLAAQRNGQAEELRAAAQQWLRLAPGDAEAQELVERLRVAAERQPESFVRRSAAPPEIEGRTAAGVADIEQRTEAPAGSPDAQESPVREVPDGAAAPSAAARVTWPWVLVLVIGWAIGGAISGNVSYTGISEWTAGGVIRGLATVAVLWSSRLLAPGRALAIAAICAIFCSFVTSPTFVFLLLWFIGAVLVSLALSWRSPSFTWGKSLATVAGMFAAWVVVFGIAFVIAEAVSGSSGGVRYGTTLGSVWGAMAGGALLWLISRALARNDQAM
jgi:serine/threonine-protein kinase